MSALREKMEHLPSTELRKLRRLSLSHEVRRMAYGLLLERLQHRKKVSR